MLGECVQTGIAAAGNYKSRKHIQISTIAAEIKCANKQLLGAAETTYNTFTFGPLKRS